ncbi:MAG: hypothetical protein ABIV51_02770 [Saprospiraceae bacterium]
MKFPLLLVLLFALPTKHCLAQDLKEIFDASVKAYEAKDYDTYLELSHQLDVIWPFNPVYTYNLASGYALTKQINNSIFMLNRLVLMDNEMSFEEDNDFADLKLNPAWKNIMQNKKEMGDSVLHAVPLLTLQEKDLHPEGLCYLPKSKKLLSGSIHKGKIVEINIESGQSIDWLSQPGMLSVVDICVDKGEKYLWAATAAFPQLIGYKPEMEGKSEILKIEIATKKILKRYSLPGTHVFGALLMNSKDDLFISDSGPTNVYVIRNGQDSVSTWLSLGDEGRNLQGLAIDSSESTIFVADYLKGILVVNANNPEQHHWLEFQDYITPKGIDGLIWHNGYLYAIHNGVKPIRVMQYRMDLKNRTIIKAVYIENNRAMFHEPTLPFILNDQLMYIANCPWNAYNKDFTLNQDLLSNPELYYLKLNTVE